MFLIIVSYSCQVILHVYVQLLPLFTYFFIDLIDGVIMIVVLLIDQIRNLFLKIWAVFQCINASKGKIK